MATTVLTATATFDVYRRALEGKDYDTLLDLYAEDAVFVSCSKASPPSSAEKLQGREAIFKLWKEAPKELAHRISDELIGDRGFAFALTCTYPSGQKVFGTYISEVRDGRITRQIATEAWDESE